VNLGFWYRDIPYLDYGYLWLMSAIQGARDIMIYKIYGPQGNSSFISKFSPDSDCQKPYCKIAGTEVLNKKLWVYIAVPAAGCHIQQAK
jgi:hypothetical protein